CVPSTHENSPRMAKSAQVAGTRTTISRAQYHRASIGMSHSSVRQNRPLIALRRHHMTASGSVALVLAPFFLAHLLEPDQPHHQHVEHDERLPQIEVEEFKDLGGPIGH